MKPALLLLMLRVESFNLDGGTGTPDDTTAKVFWHDPFVQRKRRTYCTIGRRI